MPMEFQSDKDDMIGSKNLVLYFSFSFLFLFLFLFFLIILLFWTAVFLFFVHSIPSSHDRTPSPHIHVYTHIHTYKYIHFYT